MRKPLLCCVVIFVGCGKAELAVKQKRIAELEGKVTALSQQIEAEKGRPPSAFRCELERAKRFPRDEDTQKRLLITGAGIAGDWEAAWREPDTYAGLPYAVTGMVLEVARRDRATMLRVAPSARPDETLLVASLSEPPVIRGDMAAFVGFLSGAQSFTTKDGRSAKMPMMVASFTTKLPPQGQ